MFVKIFKSKFFASEILTRYKKLSNSHQYYEIIGIQPSAPIEQVRKQYFSLLYQYHPDKNNSLLSHQLIEKQQICKIIISAYDKISNQKKGNEQKFSQTRNRSSKIYQSDTQYSQYYRYRRQRKEPLTKEELLYKQIFGNLFQQDPYSFYSQKNSHLRKIYFQRLAQMNSSKKATNNNTYNTSQTNTNNSKSSTKSAQQTQNTQSPKSYPAVNTQTKGSNFLLIASLFATSALIYAFFKESKTEKITKTIASTPTLSDQKLQKIKNNFQETLQSKINSIKNQFVNELPPSLKYNTGQDPEIYSQILKYSIVPDIELYQAQTKPFYFPQKYAYNDDFMTTPINRIKPNTILTLGLEAQRCLHNIYVNRKEVLRQINENGTYTPPAILFRFHGYIYFKIRDKPLNLENYKNTQWISLFDLYFQYYSPIFRKKDEWNQFRVNTAFSPSELEANTIHIGNFIGNSHLNNRPIPVIYLTGKQKNVFMWKPKNTVIENEYQNIWGGFYGSLLKQ